MSSFHVFHTRRTFLLVLPFLSFLVYFGYKTVWSDAASQVRPTSDVHERMHEALPLVVVSAPSPAEPELLLPASKAGGNGGGEWTPPSPPPTTHPRHFLLLSIHPLRPRTLTEAPLCHTNTGELNNGLWLSRTTKLPKDDWIYPDVFWTVGGKTTQKRSRNKRVETGYKAEEIRAYQDRGGKSYIVHQYFSGPPCPGGFNYDYTAGSPAYVPPPFEWVVMPRKVINNVYRNNHDDGPPSLLMEENVSVDEGTEPIRACQLVQWSAAKFCEGLGPNRTILLLGDSTMLQVSKWLWNAIYGELGEQGCQAQIYMQLSDSLGAPPGMVRGSGNRGPNWTHALIEYQPDVVILNAGLHVRVPEDFVPLFDLFLRDLAWMRNPMNPNATKQKPFHVLWKSQPQVGCGLPNKRINLNAENYSISQADADQSTQTAPNNSAPSSHYEPQPRDRMPTASAKANKTEESLEAFLAEWTQHSAGPTHGPYSLKLTTEWPEKIVLSARKQRQIRDEWYSLGAHDQYAKKAIRALRNSSRFDKPFWPLEAVSAAAAETAEHAARDGGSGIGYLDVTPLQWRADSHSSSHTVDGRGNERVDCFHTCGGPYSPLEVIGRILLQKIKLNEL